MYKKIYNSRVLEFFFDDPDSITHIREIARRTGMHPNMVLRDVHALSKKDILIITPTKAVVNVKVNKENNLFYTLKKLRNLAALYLSDIVDIIEKEYNTPEAIVLFGSYCRGEDTIKSDIDIAVITKRNEKIDMHAFEKILKRKIQVHEVDLKKTGKTFLSTLVNGIVLKGYLNL